MPLSKEATRKGWLVAFEDTHALYWRRVYGLRYLFAEVLDMDDACGEDNEGQSRFAWEASLVDLSMLDPVEQAAAIHSGIGMDQLQKIIDEKGQQASFDTIAEACHQYGGKATLDSGSCSRYEWATARVIKAADLAVASEESLDAALQKPCNTIGSTGYDCLQGDILAGLRRSADKVMSGEPVDQNAVILLKMYGACDGQTLGAGRQADLAEAGKKLASAATEEKE